MSGNTTECVLALGREGEIVGWDIAAGRMFGHCADEALGRTVDFLQRPKHSPALAEKIARATNRGKRWSGHLAFLRKDGSEGSCDVTLVPMSDSREVPVSAIAICRDTSDRLRPEGPLSENEEQLHRAQKMESLGHLAGGIAHDFNNILLPIITITEITKDELPPESKQAAQLGLVLQAAWRGRTLVDQVLKFSRRQPIAMQPIDIRPVVKEAMALCASTLPAGVEIRPLYVADSTRVLANSDQVQEVVTNLVVNAAQAIGSEDTGVIEVSLSKVTLPGPGLAGRLDLAPGCYAHLTIEDNGCGMDEDTLAQVFDPFFTTKPIGNGTGMGLAVVHGIVADHGGGITASSEIDRGTIFEVYLPIVAPEAASKRGASTGEADGAHSSN